MINLIPPEARTRIIAEYWVRVVSVWLFMLAVAALTIAALLLPAYVLVNVQVGVYEASAGEATARVSENTESEKVLVAASVQARMIVEEAQRTSMMHIYDSINEVADQEAITIDVYTLARNEGAFREVRIEGEATTRLALASFRDRLIDHALIEKVDLPISNLAKDREVPFSLLLTIASSTTSQP